MENLLRGMIAMGFATAGLFFLRFWWDSRDRFFALFALAFFALGLNRVFIAFVEHGSEVSTYLYIVRLLAFVIILFAIVDKNLPRKRI